jgi:hypothetical protein
MQITGIGVAAKVIREGVAFCLYCMQFIAALDDQFVSSCADNMVPSGGAALFWSLVC